MRERLTGFVQHLRSAGIRISVAETLDAMAAVKKAGVDPVVLREALSATLVKDEADREVFDAAFDAFFAPPPRLSPPGARRGPGPGAGEPAAAGAGRGGGGGGAATRPRPEVEPTPPTRSARAAPGRSRAAPEARPHEARADERRAADGRKPGEARRAAEPSRAAEKPRAENARRAGEAQRAAAAAAGEAARRGARALASRRELRRKPLADLTPAELDEAARLARELGRRFAARASRREKRERSGRIDVRRTIRGALGRGGAMIVLERRGRRPGKPRLVVLCDVSGSVARASELLLSILAAAESAFRGVARHVYVDRLVPVAFEGGHILPEGELDLWARSDFGAVLRDLEERHGERLDRSTVLLVLGDARNNRRPARADVLRRLAQRLRAVVLAIPEPRARWNTGDSALAAYAEAADLVLEATTLDGLLRAVRAAARR